MAAATIVYYYIILNHPITYNKLKFINAVIKTSRTENYFSVIQ